ELLREIALLGDIDPVGALRAVEVFRSAIAQAQASWGAGAGAVHAVDVDVRGKPNARCARQGPPGVVSAGRRSETHPDDRGRIGQLAELDAGGLPRFAARLR